MRTLFGSDAVSSVAGTPVQLRSDSTLRVVNFQASLRVDVGSDPVYLGNDSTVDSANGWELSSASGAKRTFEITYPVRGGGANLAGVKATQFYINSSASSGRVDHAMTVVP